MLCENQERRKKMNLELIGFLIILTSMVGCSLPYPTELRYNDIENEWTYAKPEEELRYNIIEDRWEFYKKGEQK